MGPRREAQATLIPTTQTTSEQVELLPPTNGAPKEAIIPAAPTPLSILHDAVCRGADIGTIERLVALQDKMIAQQAEIEFNEALNRVQKEIKRVAPDLENKQKASRYASYAAIDRVVRPLYSAEGFSLSFTHADAGRPDFIRVICRVALRGHKELYQVDWPVDTKGPQGSAVMTATQATGASDSYAKRYLVKDIFNIAIGEDDTDGEMSSEARDFVLKIEASANAEELKKNFREAKYRATETRDGAALLAYTNAWDKRSKELQGR